MEKLFVPLLTRNDSNEFAEMCSIEFKIAGIEDPDYSMSENTLYFERLQASNYYGRADFRGRGSERTNAYCSFISNGIPMLTGEIRVTIQSDNTPSNIVLNVRKANYSTTGANIETDSILEIAPVDISQIEGTGKQYMVLFSFEQEQTSVLNNAFGNAYSYMQFSFAYLPDGSSIISAEGNIKVTNIAEQVLIQKNIGTGSMGEIYTDGRFWIVPNLPDIKQIDFIKAIASILGLFAVSGIDGSIIFVSMDDLYNNKEKALDWTRNVVADTLENKPKEITYTLEGFAQRNNCKWAEDSTVTGNYDSFLEVNDKTLEYETDSIELPFAATDMYGGKARIPLYSYTEYLGIQYNDVEPRLLLISGTNGIFKGLGWKELIDKYYSSYQTMIRRPVVIKEKIEISDVDLREIDVTVPVYLAQYGRYYAIISIKAEDTGICECELLQLEV